MSIIFYKIFYFFYSVLKVKLVKQPPLLFNFTWRGKREGGRGYYIHLINKPPPEFLSFAQLSLKFYPPPWRGGLPPFIGGGRSRSRDLVERYEYGWGLMKWKVESCFKIFYWLNTIIGWFGNKIIVNNKLDSSFYNTLPSL